MMQLEDYETFIIFIIRNKSKVILQIVDVIAKRGKMAHVCCQIFFSFDIVISGDEFVDACLKLTV